MTKVISFEGILKLLRVVLFVLFTSYSSNWILSADFGEARKGEYLYFSLKDRMPFKRELVAQSYKNSQKVNEQNIYEFLAGREAALTEEIISGNKYALAKFLTELEIIRNDDRTSFWSDTWWKYRIIIAMIRSNPDLLLETIAQHKQEINPRFICLFYPSPDLYGYSACLYLLRSRIKSLEKVEKPELKEIRDEYLLKMKDNLSLLSKEKNGKEQIHSSLGDKMNEKFQIKLNRADFILPEEISRAKQRIENCPCPSNIHLLLKALRSEKDEAVMVKVMRLCLNITDLLWEEFISGNEEAVEIFLMFYKYGEHHLYQEAVEADITTLLRCKPDVFLKALKKNMNLFYTTTLTYPVDSVTFLPRIKEVCKYFLSKRIEALMRVQDKELVSLRDICIYNIKAKIEEINKSREYETLSLNANK
ncbi:MAG: hypothetical protein H5U06_10075 [Candidatus Aminicenantes bacterium]|nr:hypothetical protein [Candidatus Aminicenantes bacterium]